MIDPNVRRSEQEKYHQQQQRKNASQRAKKLKTAKKKAKKSFAPTPVGKAVNQCPLANMKAASAELISAPKPVTEVRQKCSLIRTDVLCEHNERKAKSNLLEVVPKGGYQPELASSSGLSQPKNPQNKAIPTVSVTAKVNQGATDKGDKLTLKAILHQNCGGHPIWKIKDEKKGLVKQQVGESISFEFLPPRITENDVPNILQVWWLKDVKPHSYLIECSDHENATTTTNVHVYPSIESSLSIGFGSAAKGNAGWEKNIQNLRDILKEVADVIKELIPNVKELNVKVLEGSLSLKNSWAENSSDNRAYWEAEISVNLEPIFSINGKYGVTPAWIPKFILDYADVYPYIGLKGEITAKGSFKWKGGHYEQGGGTVTGAVTGSVGVSGYIGKKYKVISVDLNGGTKLSAECKLIGTVEPQITLSGKLKWDPLTVKASLEVLDGLIKKNKELSLFSQKEYLLGTIEFLSKKTSGGGGGGGGGGSL